VYSRKIKDRDLTFGISGLLYKSNVLMYDHETESLWSQVKGKAVTGPMAGTPLKVLPSTITTWKKWKKRFPKTEVLSPETGHLRDYSRDPYEDYYKRKRGLFSLFKPGPGEEEKALVAGVILNSATKAYPLEELRKKGTLTDHLDDKEITLTFNTKTDVLTIKDKKGNDIPYIMSYWFVWKGIHPETMLFKLNNKLRR
jgi:hypothetical protein